VDATKINSFAHVAAQTNVPPSEESIFVLSSSQLQEILSRAIQPLQDRIDSLETTVAGQQEEISALKATEEQDYRANSRDIRDIFEAIAEIEHNTKGEQQPLQKDRGEILRALLAANNGKMLAKEARQKMRLSQPLFSMLLAKMKDTIEVKPYHLRRNQKLLILR
jgi:uncharacterized coiled-coil protein SlyX